MARPADPHAKEALVAAARAEFQRRGLRGARIEDITASCGLSKGAFYLHFESKEALFKTLVDGFMTEMAAAAVERMQAAHTFLEDHGALTARDFQQHTQKFRLWHDVQSAVDLKNLELMWQYRDVLDVLITGCAGTPFEKTVWEVVDAEVARIATDSKKFQDAGCLRTDAPSELFGAMVVGTYLLVGKQMARATVKPDLATMARALHMLIHEGAVASSTLGRDEMPGRESVSSGGARKRRPAVAKKKNHRTAALRSS